MHNVRVACCFIGVKMKTSAKEKAPQIALRNFSKEAGGKVSIYQILVMGEYMQSRHIFPEDFC